MKTVPDTVPSFHHEFETQSDQDFISLIFTCNEPTARKTLEDMMIEQEENLTRFHNSQIRALEARYKAYNDAEKEKFKKAKAQLKGKGACAKEYDKLQTLWYKQLGYFRDLNIQNEDNAKIR